MNEINGVSVPFIPIQKEPASLPKRPLQGYGKFGSIFQQEIEQLKISAHANKRLEARNIELSAEKMDKLKEAVHKAEVKGAKDTLIMMDNTAFIVNVPNKTVITAIPIDKTEENVFTNIDSVVFAL
ncbi:MAG TPA: TIGR02530 family flagellar biosynthesis protein [Ignavibacteriales bacterium]|nr:TIGR02530 family flagellar biosynthesis protein [Ignavibacteriales bacterium]